MSTHDAAAVPKAHRASAPRSVRCAIVTVSDTKTEADDRSGALIAELLASSPHRTAWRRIVRDEPDEIRQAISDARGQVDAIILTGGTGLTSRDSTFEVVSLLLTKPLPGFGELFRMLSFEEIGAAAMMSRACAGVSDGLVVFALPGSSGGCRTAVTRLILPELGHIMEQLSR